MTLSEFNTKLQNAISAFSKNVISEIQLSGKSVQGSNGVWVVTGADVGNVAKTKGWLWQLEQPYVSSSPGPYPHIFNATTFINPFGTDVQCTIHSEVDDDTHIACQGVSRWVAGDDHCLDAGGALYTFTFTLRADDTLFLEAWDTGGQQGGRVTLTFA